ncbi:histidine kinase [Streptomyces sp. NPDC002785]|uniref:sensor histidine kinase n=1 Tax=Streptomyces sp. NPDC002785 TaxID=3154543 RepID=UPI003320555E
MAGGAAPLVAGQDVFDGTVAGRLGHHLAARGRVRAGLTYGVLASALPWVWPPPLTGAVTPAYGAGLIYTLALVAGLWWRSRRRLVDSLAEQVELRAEQARLAERARIAAEMHDVLAHRLSLLALHTGVLAMRSDTLPPQAAKRIALLRTTSTQALADLRDVLGALRGDADAQKAVPVPALQDLSALLDEARSSGQHIDTEVSGDSDGAPASHRLAVHRIVQEGLTNARKHAPGAAVRLRVHFGGPATEVEVVNGMAAAASPHTLPSGYGLIGLTERVAGLHGSLDHGPAPDGWRLTARIPLPGPTGGREPS